MELLLRSVSAAVTAREPAPFLEQMYEQLAGILGLELYVHHRLDGSGSFLELVAHRGLPPSHRERLQRLRLGESVCGAVAAACEPITVEDIQRGTDAPLRVLREMGLSVYTCHPLMARGRLIGTLSFGSRTRARFDESSLALIRATCDLVAEVIDRSVGETRLAESSALIARQLQEIESIYETAPVGLCQLDTELRFVRINRRLATLNGLSVEEHIGRSVREILPNLADEMEPLLRRVIETGQPAFDVHIAAGTPTEPDVVRHWIQNWAPLRDAAGRVIGVNVVVREVTDEMRIQSRLREAERRQRFLYEATKVLTGSLDPAGTFQALAELAVPILGDFCIFDILGEDGRVHRAGAAHCAPERRAFFQGALDRVPPVETRHHPAWRVIWDGKPVLVPRVTDGSARRSAASPEHLEFIRAMGVHSALIVPLVVGDRCLGALTFCFDISDRSHTEQDLELAQELAQRAAIAVYNMRLYRQALEREESLRESDRRKDEFLAVLAHELRGPLAPLRNGLHLLRLSTGGDSALARPMEIMERQLARMVRLIDDLLDISRISRGKLSLERVPVALSAAIDDAIETTRPLIDQFGHTLEVSLPARPVTVRGDRTRLAQIFANLLSNSAKYTEPGGRIEITAAQENGFVTVHVRDTGIGIAPEALPKIFEMFSQADAHRDRMSGLGIGLALSRGLVALHGGTLSASSPGIGKGSTFTVRLPVLESAEEPDGDTSTGIELRKAERPLRILVVDDQADSADSLAALLSLMGHQVQKAYGGFEAVARFEAGRFDVVFMDIGMPEMDGLEASRRIRALPEGKRVRIIALTGWGQSADRARTRAAGIDQHLVKPVALEDLQRSLEPDADRQSPRRDSLDRAM